MGAGGIAGGRREAVGGEQPLHMSNIHTRFRTFTLPRGGAMDSSFLSAKCVWGILFEHNGLIRPRPRVPVRPSSEYPLRKKSRNWAPCRQAPGSRKDEA